MLETDSVRVLATTLQPSAVVPRHTHQFPHLLVAVSDLDLRSTGEDGATRSVRMSAGDVQWVNAGVTHTLANASAQPARYVAVEFTH